jgi:hypothetical protein
MLKLLKWTRDGELRQPVFPGLGEDKEAAAAIRERFVWYA